MAKLPPCRRGCCISAAACTMCCMKATQHCALPHVHVQRNEVVRAQGARRLLDTAEVLCSAQQMFFAGHSSSAFRWTERIHARKDVGRHHGILRVLTSGGIRRSHSCVVALARLARASPSRTRPKDWDLLRLLQIAGADNAPLHQAHAQRSANQSTLIANASRNCSVSITCASTGRERRRQLRRVPRVRGSGKPDLTPCCCRHPCVVEASGPARSD